jgi:FkbH-like protein
MQLESSMSDLVSMPSHVRAKQRWRSFDAAAVGKPIDMRVGVAATFTVDGLLPMLGTALLDAGFSPAICSAGYNQVFQVCLDPSSQFSSGLDAAIFLWRIEEVMGEEFARYTGGELGALSHAFDRLEELIRALKVLRGRFDGVVVVSIPPFPQLTPAHLLDLDTATNAGRFHRAIVERVTDRLVETGEIRIVDFDALQRNFGAQSAVDARKWYLYKQPYTELFLWSFGQQIARVLSASRRAAKKCVVLDCDNTLWGGIVGEDGVDGLALGEDFPGSAFRDLQKLMLYLHGRGVLIALASKNNESDVWDVFDRHDGMVLKREHIAAWRINWEPKSGNIRAIADELNIGIDSIVFIDDNPFEIDQTQFGMDGLTAVQLSEEPAEMVRALRALNLFDVLQITNEDVQRTAMMRSERNRSYLTVGLSPEEFAASLGLIVTFGQASEAQLGRVAQLINKTNQFNLTTVRRTLEQVKSIHRTIRSWGVYTITVEDKFGSYGLVGVAIVEKFSNRWRLDTFLLSCRVLGRYVETSFLAEIGTEARRLGVSTLEAAFIPTSKNLLAENFLLAHGFSPLGEQRFEIDVDKIPSAPSHVSLRTFGNGLADA